MVLLSILFTVLVAAGALLLITRTAHGFFRAESARALATKHQRTLANIYRMELELGLVEPPNAALPAKPIPPGMKIEYDQLLNAAIITPASPPPPPKISGDWGPR